MKIKEQLINFIESIDEGSVIFCNQVSDNGGALIKYESVFKMNKEDLLNFFNENYNNDLVDSNGLQILNWKVLK